MKRAQLCLYVRNLVRNLVLLWAGQLSIFIGAGVSTGAGLPNWNELLQEVNKKLGGGCDAPSGKGLDPVKVGLVVPLIGGRLELDSAL